MGLTARPIVLIVLDGFGISPPDASNAITRAQKPFFDSLVSSYPTMLVEASGLAVGLPRTEFGNSEVGHMAIGSGILRYQSLPRIDRAIETGELFELPAMKKLVAAIGKTGKLHLVGLIGNGGVHSSQQHLAALIDFARKEKILPRTYVHAFLDGRDTAKDVGIVFLRELIGELKEPGHIATVGGRFYGMDRNLNWDRIQKAYDAIVFGKAEKMASDPVKAVQDSYAANVFDEQLLPFVCTKKDGTPVATVDDGDAILYFNFRSDRARQLTEAFVVHDFKEFERKPLSSLQVTTFAEYKKGLPVDVIFPPEIIQNPITKIVSDAGLKQLHAAETEKYAHVTFFLNGMQEAPFPGEDRILVPSPSVASYDERPEMSAFAVTDKIIEALESGMHDFIAINYANPDMVGHTGNLAASIKAIAATDQCLARVVPAALAKGGLVFIVSDHGNAEILVNPVTREPDKEHNFSPVPFLIVGNQYKGRANPMVAENDLSLLQPVGLLSDVAPTICALSGLPIAPEMTGTRLY
jgi:2,3-bisphosphoglycerate-independent phosphoglycerate mutase